MREHFDLPVGGRFVKATIETPSSFNGQMLWLLGRGAARLDSLADRQRQAQLFQKEMLSFDYTGQGETGGDFGRTTIKGHLAEAVAAVDWLKGHADLPLTISGASYGGFLAALLAADQAASNLVLRAPALFPAELLDVQWRELEPQVAGLTKNYRQDVGLMLQNPVFEKLATFAGRILIIEHADDEVIPKAVSQAYKQALPQADYWVAPGIMHSVTASGRDAQDIYEKYIADWLNG